MQNYWNTGTSAFRMSAPNRKITFIFIYLHLLNVYFPKCICQTCIFVGPCLQTRWIIPVVPSTSKEHYKTKKIFKGGLFLLFKVSPVLNRMQSTNFQCLIFICLLRQELFFLRCTSLYPQRHPTFVCFHSAQCSSVTTFKLPSKCNKKKTRIRTYCISVAQSHL